MYTANAPACGFIFLGGMFMGLWSYWLYVQRSKFNHKQNNEKGKFCWKILPVPFGKKVAGEALLLTCQTEK